MIGLPLGVDTAPSMRRKSNRGGLRRPAPAPYSAFEIEGKFAPTRARTREVGVHRIMPNSSGSLAIWHEARHGVADPDAGQGFSACPSGDEAAVPTVRIARSTGLV
jgi:hypothetical protein